jgi:hypothetical protein
MSKRNLSRRLERLEEVITPETTGGEVSGRADLAIRYRRGYVDESSDPEEEPRTALWNPIDSSGIA